MSYRQVRASVRCVCISFFSYIRMAVARGIGIKCRRDLVLANGTGYFGLLGSS